MALHDFIKGLEAAMSGNRCRLIFFCLDMSLRVSDDAMLLIWTHEDFFLNQKDRGGWNG